MGHLSSTAQLSHLTWRQPGTLITLSLYFISLLLHNIDMEEFLEGALLTQGWVNNRLIWIHRIHIYYKCMRDINTAFPSFFVGAKSSFCGVKLLHHCLCILLLFQVFNSVDVCSGSREQNALSTLQFTALAAVGYLGQLNALLLIGQLHNYK